MKAIQKITNVAPLIAVAAALAVTVPGRLAAAQPSINHIEFSFVSTTICGFPVLVHYTATEISQINPGTGKFTDTFNARSDYTNPANGKTVTAVGAGPFYTLDDGTQVYHGLFMVHTPDGVVVDAGVEELAFVYDPDTGTGQFVTSMKIGTDTVTSDVWAAVCAALQ